MTPSGRGLAHCVSPAGGVFDQAARDSSPLVASSGEGAERRIMGRGGMIRSSAGADKRIPAAVTESASLRGMRHRYIDARHRFLAGARTFGFAELGYALLLLSAFVLPNWFGYPGWVPALALATVLAVAHGLRSGHPPIIPLGMGLYLAAYTVSGLHSNPATFSIVEAGKYFAPPVFCLAIAWAAQNYLTRRNIVLLGLWAVALQVPIALYQATDLVVSLGGNAFQRADSVAGLLSPQQVNALGLVGLFAAVLVFAAGALGRLRLRWAVPATIALVFLSILSSTRGSYGFAPAAFLAIAVALFLAAAAGMVTWRPAITAIASAIAVVPVLYFGIQTLYTGANLGLGKSQALSAREQYKWQGTRKGDVPTTQTTEGATGGQAGTQQEDQSTSANAASAGTSSGASGEASSKTTNANTSKNEAHTQLPGRLQQLKVALRLSVRNGPLVSLLGRGIGDTRFKGNSVTSSTPFSTEPLTRADQRTNGVWVPRILSETGFLGVLAFCGLQLYLLVLWWRNRQAEIMRRWDAAVVYALPGVAAITFLGGFYTTILVSQPYATLIWGFLGVAIAIDAERRSLQEQ
jgi:hypothetical protein